MPAFDIHTGWDSGFSCYLRPWDAGTPAVVSASCSHVSHRWISSVEVPIKKAHERFMRLYRGCDSYCGGGVVAGFFLLLFLVVAGAGLAGAGVGSAGAASAGTVVPAGNIHTSSVLLGLALVRVSLRFGSMPLPAR